MRIPVLSLLVSFYSPDGQFGSHVLEMPEAPLTAQAVLDIQTSLAMEYNTTAIALLNWGFLLDETTHPSSGSPYSYFLTYSFSAEYGKGFGFITYMAECPIYTLTDLRSVEEELRASVQAWAVHLVSCKALREPTPDHLQKYWEAWQLRNQG